MNITTLDKISDIYNGNSINAEYKRKHFCGLNEGYPFIATKDVSASGVVNYDNGVKIPFDTNYKIANPNSVFICAEGGSAGRKIGFIEKDVCFGNKLFCIKPNEDKVLGKFVYYYANSESFHEQFRNLLAGLIGGVSITKFKSISIPLPPLDKQQEIVDFLDTQFKNIDALKSNAAQQLQDAKDLFQAALNKELKPTDGWVEKTLKDIGKTQTGTTPKTSDKGNYGDYIPFIKPADVNTDGLGGLNYNNEGLSQQGAANGRVFASGSILMVCIGTIGKVGYAIKQVSSNQQINILTPKTDYDSKFLYYCMASPAFQFKVIKEGESAKATIPIINKSKWERLTVHIPNLMEQKTIVARLDNLNARCKVLQTNYENTLTLCNDLKQALLKQIFE